MTPAFRQRMETTPQVLGFCDSAADDLVKLWVALADIWQVETPGHCLPHFTTALGML
jgi:hypothetical protein